MEVTTVPPSAISPTEGDDLCEIDATNVAIHSVTLLIGLCGLAGNGAVLCLLTWKWRNANIIFMAVTDFLFLLITVPSSLLFLLEDVSGSPIMSLVYLSFLFQLPTLSYFTLSCVTCFGTGKAITFLCSLCFRCHLNECLIMWIDLLFICFTAIVFVLGTILCSLQEQRYCQTALISMFAVILLLFSARVVISSTIYFIKSKRGSQQQQPKRHNIVIVLIVLFTLLLSLWNFLQQLRYINMSSQVVFLLTCINSSIKPFICFLAGSSRRPRSMGRCWRHCTVGSLRDSLRRVFEEPEENTPSSNDASRDTVM